MLIKGGEEDRARCGALLNACAGLCVLLAALVEPYMPSITRKVSSCSRDVFSAIHILAEQEVCRSCYEASV